MGYRILISEVAWFHLDGLYGYIAREAGEPIAVEFAGEIQRSILRLEDFPRLGRRRDSATIPNLFTIPHKTHTLIAYTIDDVAGTVIILGVYYGGQDYEKYLGLAD